MTENRMYPDIVKQCNRTCCIKYGDFPTVDIIYCNPLCTTCNPPDMVNHPPHYKSSPAKCFNCGERIECIEVVRHMPFNIGNAVKYLWRYKLKNGIECLKKAVWYIQDEIKQLESQNATNDKSDRE